MPERPDQPGPARPPRTWRPDALSMLLVLLACLALLFYFSTAVITGGGGFGVTLAFKPLHGVYPFYHPVSGEEWAWDALKASPNPPWWVTGDYIRLYDDSWEGGWPLWAWAYEFCYYAALLCLPASLARMGLRSKAGGRAPEARSIR